MVDPVQRGKAVSGKGWAIIALVAFALLIFTTVHTSPISAGAADGSSLSKTTPKQRESTVPDIASVQPVLDLLALVPVAYGSVPVVEYHAPRSTPFFGRYFTLPPPTV